MKLIVNKKQNNPSEIHLKPSLFDTFFFELLINLRNSYNFVKING